MPTDDASRSPNKRCHNCGLPCKGMFCCGWCFKTYLARQDAHRAARRRRAPTKADKDSPAGAA